jgi:hypothetical protein
MKRVERRRIHLLIVAGCLMSLTFCVEVSQASLGSILMDSYYSSWISNHVENLTSELTGAGYTVALNESAIGPGSLDEYDVYVLFFPGQTHEITAGEADAIAAWVEGGGGLWLGGSMGGVNTTESCNAVSARWGVTFNTNNISGVVTDITHGHAVTDGSNPPETQVNSFGIYDGCSLTLADGLSLARYGGETVMAAVEPGSGRAILIGDSVQNGPFDDDNLGAYDNLDLALNTVEYVVPEPTSVALLGLGALLLGRRRARG